MNDLENHCSIFNLHVLFKLSTPVHQLPFESHHEEQSHTASSSSKYLVVPTAAVRGTVSGVGMGILAASGQWRSNICVAAFDHLYL